MAKAWPSSCTTIETSKITFDYQPQPDELTPPASFEDGDRLHLGKLAAAAGL